MAKLIHKNKILLKEMKIATNVWEISRGLMFASKKRVRQGICLTMPTNKDVKFGASVTMLFCFQKLQIIFVNKNMKVVDKKILKPWLPTYTPKAACMYVIESEVGTFEDIRIGDIVEIPELLTITKKKKKGENKI